MDHPLIEEAMILAGGLGTRLRPMVQEVPKPMADVAGRPFLEYLLYYLHRQGCRSCVLAVGYKHEAVSGFFGNSYMGMKLLYAVEKMPLGTGGGIVNALHHISQNNFFLLNGDSFFNVDLRKLSGFHFYNNAAITLSLKEMRHISRYGTVAMQDARVVCFNEKMTLERGCINGGVYVLSKDVFAGLETAGKFSFEKDILETKAGVCPIYGFVSKGYFIDIGVPEDYVSAQNTLPKELRLP